MATKRLTISLTPELYAQVAELAHRSGSSLSAIAAEALRRLAESPTRSDSPVAPWERRLVAERLEAHRNDPEGARSWEEVHTAAMEEIRKARVDL